MSTVVIVGASRGIGQEFAKQYSLNGDTVYATSRTPEMPGELGTYDNTHILGLDVRFKKQREHFVHVLREIDIDVFIYNAGVLPKHVETLEELLEINVRAPILLGEACLPMIARSFEKKLVLIGGTYGSRQLSKERNWNSGIYGHSKLKLNDNFRQVSSYWGEKNIIAVVFSPGSVKTDMNPIKGRLSPEQSVSSMRRIIATLDKKDHGKFLNWEGYELPW